jgi:hypothetical protein
VCVCVCGRWDFVVSLSVRSAWVMRTTLLTRSGQVRHQRKEGDFKCSHPEAQVTKVSEFIYDVFDVSGLGEEDTYADGMVSAGCI